MLVFLVIEIRNHGVITLTFPVPLTLNENLLTVCLLGHLEIYLHYGTQLPWLFIEEMLALGVES